MAAILVHHLGFLDLSKTLTKSPKIELKVTQTNKNIIKWSKDLKMLQESFPLICKLREIENWKNMPLKIWLPWKRQVTWTVTCHIKLLPDNFLKKSASSVAFASILKKLLTSKVTAGRILPPPPTSPGLNRVKKEIIIINK